MRVEQYDAFALKSYAFQLHKTNNFFSLLTILISFGILITSLVINFSTLSHIWLPRSQLPMLISSSIFFPDPLSFSLVCYKSALDTTVPTARVLNQQLTQISIEILNQAEVKSLRPELAQKIGQNFACFNFQNIAFSPTNQEYIIQIFTSNATLFVQQSSSDSIILNTYEDPVVISSEDPNSFKYLLVQILSVEISDSLFISYQPEILNTFLKSNLLDFQKIDSAPFQSTNIKFGIRLFSPTNLVQNEMEINYNIMNLVITRFNIGYIIGAVASWVSALALLLSFVVGPLMDSKYKLLQVETLFFIKPAFRKPNLTKFIIASYIQGIFQKEDHFVKLIEQIENLKDICLILKTQRTVSKIYESSTNAVEPQIIACQQSFAEPYPFEMEASVFSQGKSRSLALSRFQQDKKWEGKVSNLRKRLLSWLDSGSDEVSVQYGGNGHGSKTSVYLSALFGIGFLAFLIIFGVFRFDKTTAIYSQVSLETIEYTFATNELFFTTFTSTNYSIQLTNGKYEYLSTVVLTSGSECLKRFKNASTVISLGNLTVLPQCLLSPITLKYSSNSSESVLLRFNLPESFTESIYVGHNSLLNAIQQVNPIDNNYIVSYYSELQQCFYTNTLKVIHKQQGGNLLKTSQILPNGGCITNILQAQPIIGYYLSIDNKLTIVQTNTNSIFDIMQNVWSLALICFTVILMKIAKHINLRQKNANVTAIRAQFRQNLCILLSKVNTMLTGRHRNELLKGGYFLKQELLGGHSP